MRKTRSTASLATLAMSVKHSIQLPPNYHPTHNHRTAAKLCSLSIQPTSLTTQPTPRTHLLPPAQSSSSDKVTALHTRIGQLEKQLQESGCSNKKMSMKQYEDSLKRYEQIGHEIGQTEQQIKVQEMNLQSLKSRACMLEQDRYSKQMNLEDELAEMEYHEELIERYKCDYDTESAVLLDLVGVKSRIGDLSEEARQIQICIKGKEREFQNWKQESGFCLQDKVNQQKVTQYRMALMKVEDEANTMADQLNLLKFREILCLYIRSYAAEGNCNMGSHELEEGMEIYICRNSLVEEYEQSVMRYRNRANGRYRPEIVERYFALMKKIEGVLGSPKYCSNLRIHRRYRVEIEQLRKKLIDTQDQVEDEKKKIAKLSANLEQVLASHSVAVIEHLRQDCGQYELKEIKQTLKKLKADQQQRISQIEGALNKLHILQKRTHEVDSIFFMNELQDLQAQANIQSKQLKSTKRKLELQVEEKVNLEEHMNLGISRWNQSLTLKAELRELYRQLNLANKETKQAKLLDFKARSSCATLKSSNSCASLRQTIKMRASRIQKQNCERNIEQTKRYDREWAKEVQCAINRKMNFGKTGKTLSLRDPQEGAKRTSGRQIKLTGSIFGKTRGCVSGKDGGSRGGREDMNSLTSMLLSKFAR